MIPQNHPLDSLKTQKYVQTVVSTRIAPGCAPFLRKEKRFHTAWVHKRSFDQILNDQGHSWEAFRCRNKIQKKSALT